MRFLISNYTNKKLKLKFQDEDQREYEQVYPSEYLQIISEVDKESEIDIEMNGSSIPVYYSDQKVIEIGNLPDEIEGFAIVVTRRIAEALKDLNRNDIFYPEVISESSSMITASELRRYRTPTNVLINVKEKSHLAELSED